MTRNKTVTVYDLATKKTQVIPASELAPGMAQAQVEGVGLVWINLVQATASGHRHPPFESDVRQLIDQKIRVPLAEVRPMTLEQWEDGFRRDGNPEKEIALWARLAEKFTGFAEAESLDRAQRVDCFKVMLNATISPPEQVLEVVTLTAMTQDQARRAIKAFIRTGD